MIGICKYKQIVLNNILWYKIRSGIEFCDCPLNKLKVKVYLTQNSMRQTTNKIKKILAGITVLSVIATGVLVFAPSAFAGPVSNVTVSATGITSNSAATNIAVTPTFSFQTSNNLTVDGHFIQITMNGFVVEAGQTLDYTDLTLTGCNTNGLEASSGTNDNGNHEVAITNENAGDRNPVVLITLDSNSGTAPTCNAGTLTIAVASGQLRTSNTAGNYAIGVLTSLDAGAGLFYVGDENDVFVTGSVGATLSFVIRNSADTADQANVNGGTVGPNLCQLSPTPLTTTSVRSCAYRLKVATNADSGYTVSYQASGGFTNGSHVMNNASTSGEDVTAGTEDYGVVLTAGSATGGTVTRGTAFSGTATDTFYFAATTATVVYSCDGRNAPAATDTTNTALITHEAAIQADTPVGVYTQTVTYTVVPQF